MEEIFVRASKKKYRFEFRGLISVEDLWDLSVKNLDEIFKNLNAEIKKAEQESLFSDKSNANEELNDKIEIVKYIFGVKQEEAKSRKEAAERKKKRERIAEILAKKQDESLEAKSEEELMAMLEEL